VDSIVGEFDGLAIAHGHRVSFGNGVFIGYDVYLDGGHGDGITIGNNTWIGPGVYMHGAGGIVIGDYVGIGPHVKILTSTHRIDGVGWDSPIIDNDLVFSPVRIHDNADIGIGAIIMPGVVIGEGVMVGAGSVVTKSIFPFAVAAGNPARVLRYRNVDNGGAGYGGI